jgi:hypothetical protein
MYDSFHIKYPGEENPIKRQKEHWWLPLAGELGVKGRMASDISLGLMTCSEINYGNDSTIP